MVGSLAELDVLLGRLDAGQPYPTEVVGAARGGGARVCAGSPSRTAGSLTPTRTSCRGTPSSRTRVAEVTTAVPLPVSPPRRGPGRRVARWLVALCLIALLAVLAGVLMVAFRVWWVARQDDRPRPT